MNCIVVDDDNLSRTLISNMVSKIPNIHLVASCENVEEAKTVISKTPVELYFLDIEMEGTTGLEFAKTLDKDAKVVFISSKEDYAVEAFELNVVDYIVKPPSQKRLELSVDRATEFVGSSSLNYNDVFFIKKKNIFHRIKVSEVVLVESLGDYVVVYTKEDKFVVNSSMKITEARFPKNAFARIHRSYIVNTMKIFKIEDDQVFLEDFDTPYSISRSYKKHLFDMLKFFG